MTYDVSHWSPLQFETKKKMHTLSCNHKKKTKKRGDRLSPPCLTDFVKGGGVIIAWG